MQQTCNYYFKNSLYLKLKHILMKNILLLLLFIFITINSNFGQDKFAQLETLLTTPNSYRTASGAPGHEYWQQKVDYTMKVTIDEDNNKLSGEETIKYINNSPDALTYLWLQLDQNYFAKNSSSYLYGREGIGEKVSSTTLNRMEPSFDGGNKIMYVHDEFGKDLPYIINETMMRVDMPRPLLKGQTFTFAIKWWYNITNTKVQGGRSGFEEFSDGHKAYVMAQYFPRLCKYYDTYGWQNKQFMGRGEFTLEFGNYNVEITVPGDHIVAATGTLSNPMQVLSATEQKRFAQAKNEFAQPVTIVTFDEAQAKINQGKSKTQKTWKFSAENVRDFAFASSRRFIWDAMNTKISNTKSSMAMSMWTKEGHNLWSKYSTKAVAHTLKWYSHYTVDYPYPCAWSVDGNMGMEYPMIAFNNGRCEADGTYTEASKYGHISVIIHEVGHNFFPMIINSDERQWSWMDEGLNSYVEYLAEQQWERNYPSRRGPADKIVDYMKGDISGQTPIMTNSESVKQFGPSQYGKPATALNILRETVVGRELFDKSFKEYCQRWAFKTPTPSDMFRTLEDATAKDLDWFWRGWFYGIEPVDIAMSKIKQFKINPQDPNVKYEAAKKEIENAPRNISAIRNEKEIAKTYNEIDPTINDYYTTWDRNKPDKITMDEYSKVLANMSPEEKKLMEASKNYYEIAFENKGGNPMPIIVEMQFEDGTSEVKRIPAEVWRYNDATVTKVFITDKVVKQFVLDPFLETADVNRSNNYYPEKTEPSKFEMFKQQQAPPSENPMQRAKRAEEDRP
jgi:hypothetical protein